jgi:hypothetical protein
MMDLKQAREAIKANYPPENYTILIEALDWLLEQAERVEYLERRNEEVLVESGTRWTKLLKIQDILGKEL